jgi:hypothetical protein
MRGSRRAIVLVIAISSVAAAFTLGAMPRMATAASTDPVIAAAGNIACDPSQGAFKGGAGTAARCRMRYVSDMLLNADGSTKYAAVLALGDTQYICGGYTAFEQSYGPTWGRAFQKTRPVVGDKDYRTTASAPGATGCTDPPGRADGFFQYFGSKAYINPGTTVGSGAYYSFNVPSGCTPDGVSPCWHFIALNFNCNKAPGCAAGTKQYNWLASDLATYPNSAYSCTVAFWHVPRFSSGKHGSDAAYDPFWRLLYQNGVELVLNAHEHTYERFAPQSPTQMADPTNGIREFVVGTGGYGLVNFPTSARIANSQASSDKTFGILTLTLHLNSYDWAFLPEGTGTFTDVSTASTPCH